MIFSTTDIERMRITSAGVVCINTTTNQGAILSIRNQTTNTYNPSGYDVNPGISLVANSSDTSDYSGIRFGNPTGSRENLFAVVQESGGQGAFIWQSVVGGTTYTETMRLTSAGLVGIGTNSPKSIFTVGATTLTGAEISTYTTSTSGGDSSKFSFWRNYTNGSSAAFRAAYISNINSDDSYTGSNAQFLGFFTKSGTAEPAERMRIDSVGSLIVGTTSVSATVEKVSIQSNSAPNLILRSTGNPSMRFYNSSDNAATSCQINYYSGTSFSLETIPAIPMVFLTNNTERMRITSDGSVAITQAAGKYTIDTTGGATVVNNGGTVDFPSASGMLVVNCWANGQVTVYLCGGGSTSVVANVSGQVGTFAYNAGIAGYTWTSNFGSASVYGFFFLRTRNTA